MTTHRIPDVRRHYDRVSPDLVKEAATLPAGILADVYGRRGSGRAS